MSDTNDVFVADPDQFDVFDEPDLPKWPVVIGVMCIVWGAVTFLVNALGFAAAPIGSMMASNYPDGIPEVISNPPLRSYVIAAAGVLVASMLILCGSLSAMRSVRTRSVMLAYALAAFVLVSVKLWSVLDGQEYIREWVQQNPNTQYADEQATIGPIGELIALLSTAGLGYPWPAFVLFWYGFVKTKPEQYTGGVDVEVI